MANSTSKSKAKTKTTKRAAATKSTARSNKSVNKSATKAARAAKPVKDAKSAVAAKESKTTKVEAAPVVKAAKVRRTPRTLTVATLRRWEMVSAFLFAVLAVVAGLFMKPETYQVTLGHLVPNPLLSTSQTVFVPAQHALFDIELRWALVVMLVASALFLLLRATRLQAAEQRGLAVRILPWRWIDYALTIGLIVEMIALINGAQDIVTLKMLAGLTGASFLFAWIAERENAGTERVVRFAFIASLITAGLVLLGLASYTLATPLYGMVRAPWYVYVPVIAALLSAPFFALHQLKGFRRIGKRADYLFVERTYLLFNLLAKAGFAIILIVGLHK